MKPGKDALPDEEKGIIVLLINSLEVLQRQRFVEKTLVEGQSESVVNEFAVEQSQCDESTNEPIGAN